MNAPKQYTPAEFVDVVRGKLLPMIGLQHPDARADEIKMKVVNASRTNGIHRVSLVIAFRDVVHVVIQRVGWEADIIVSALVSEEPFYGSARDVAKTIALAVAYSDGPE